MGCSAEGMAPCLFACDTSSGIHSEALVAGSGETVASDGSTDEPEGAGDTVEGTAEAV